MLGNTNPRAYTVTVRAWRVKGDSNTCVDHRIELVAYDAMEAMVVASMRFDHEQGGRQLTAAGGETCVVNIEPSAHLKDAEALARMFGRT